jgi:pantetheine-phosphate adenylyltransferase
VKIAVYPGSFDPVTLGHLDIIQRSCSLFAKVIVVILVNSSKKPLFTIEERKAMLQTAIQSIPQVEVDHFAGLLVDYVYRQKAQVILRSFRNSSDFAYEWQMASMNRALNKEVETFFLMSDCKYSFISSTMVKEVASYGVDVKEFVPTHVAVALQRKFAQAESR